MSTTQGDKAMDYTDNLEAIAGLVSEPFDSIELNYTDATKTVLSTVVYRLGATIVATVTASYPSTTKEIYTKS